MRKAFSVLIVFLLLISAFPAAALEITEDDFYYWYDEMAYLVYDIGIRKLGSPGEPQACEYLRGVFQEYGFSYDNGTLFDVHAAAPEWEINDTTSLVAVKPAKQKQAPIVTVCAHFDSIYEGARDNASGVAAMLLLMRLFDGQQFDNTELRFIAFSAEESGMQGSRAYCQSLTQEERDRTIAVFNIDIFRLMCGKNCV